jgi:[ribosomal protein S5]-alanine N-acetyltransferase
MKPILTTDRLLLSAVTEQDTNELHDLFTQPEVRKYLFDNQIWSLDQVQETIAQSITAFQDNRYGLWLARLKLQQTAIGFIGYWPFFDPPEIQLIYGLAPNYWGQGFATEMARTLIDYGFQAYGFGQIQASANVPNIASIALMKRLGMVFEKQVVIDEQELVFYALEASATRDNSALSAT